MGCPLSSRSKVRCPHSAVDTHNHRMQAFCSVGSFQLQFGQFGGGDGQLGHPYDVVVDAASGNIVADTFTLTWTKLPQKVTRAEHTREHTKKSTAHRVPALDLRSLQRPVPCLALCSSRSLLRQRVVLASPVTALNSSSSPPPCCSYNFNRDRLMQRLDDANWFLKIKGDVTCFL